MSRELFVPGRLCLLGEHSDWAGAYRAVDPAISIGAAIVVGIKLGIRARARRLPRPEIVCKPGGAAPLGFTLPLDPQTLAEGLADPFLGPITGVFLSLLEAHEFGGIEFDAVRSDLPVGKGLASSAAACVLAARAVNELYDLGLDAAGEMRFAYEGERRAGSLCGRMDQVCALGEACVRMSFDGDETGIRAIAPGGPFHLVLVDLAGEKRTRRILADLNACFPAAAGDGARRCREALGLRNRELVARAVRAIEAGDAASLGRRMREAQTLFNSEVAPMSSEALSSPKLHALLAAPLIDKLGFGAKGVGSQGDGMAQILARDAECQQALATRIQAELGFVTYKLSFA